MKLSVPYLPPLLCIHCKYPAITENINILIITPHDQQGRVCCSNVSLMETDSSVKGSSDRPGLARSTTSYWVPHLKQEVELSVMYTEFHLRNKQYS